MPSPKEPVRINLTEDQKAQIRSQTGKDAEAVEFSVEELEDRIAPIAAKPAPVQATNPIRTRLECPTPQVGHSRAGGSRQTLVQHRQTFSFGGSPCPTPSSPSGSR